MNAGFGNETNLGGEGGLYYLLAGGHMHLAGLI